MLGGVQQRDAGTACAVVEVEQCHFIVAVPGHGIQAVERDQIAAFQ